MATRNDVAKQANVSTAVVSRVMTNTGYVSKDKRAAVLKAAEELNYRPSPIARSLRRGQTRQILFYWGTLSNAYFLELHRGMMDYAENKDYLICISGTSPIERIGDMMVDGLILPTEFYARRKYTQFLRKYHMPYVIIGYGEYISKNIHSVTVDTCLGMRKLIEYLRERGHRRIAFANADDTRINSPRCKCFCAMMEAVYQDKLEQYLLNFGGSISPAHDGLCRYGTIAADLFVERKLNATAVVCFNDDVALGFCRRIGQLGYRIPQDLSIVSFDGLVTGEYMNPALTSMGLNPFEHGRKCAEIIISVINGASPPHKHTIEPFLIERDSVRTL
ncbi:MAG: LacI family transcriptional regulator [Treponema sp.]|jgi:DNA-binding LacI/PurR family transcriptional regulator|nr:LacI family transcriptional regulator [Treponema sp.]